MQLLLPFHPQPHDNKECYDKRDFLYNICIVSRLFPNKYYSREIFVPFAELSALVYLEKHIDQLEGTDIEVDCIAVTDITTASIEWWNPGGDVMATDGERSVKEGWIRSFSRPYLHMKINNKKMFQLVFFYHISSYYISSCGLVGLVVTTLHAYYLLGDAG